MQLVENFKTLKKTGETATHEITLDGVLVDNNDFPANLLVELVSVKVDAETTITIDPPRRFVPTPHEATADNELIVVYSNKGPEDEKGTVLVKGHIIKDNGTIRISGSGFESATIEVSEFVPELDDPISTEE